MDDELNDIRDLFKEEARELLSELEASLLKVEESPEDKEPVNSVFRAMHTVKGSGAACGFTDIAKFAHEVETVLDLVRNGKVAVTKELINLTLSARDTILLMLDTPDGNENAYKPGVEKIVTALKRLLPDTRKEADAIIPLQQDAVEDLVRVSKEQKAAENIPMDSGQAESPADGQQMLEMREKRQKADLAATIRVPSQKLDSLVNIVGEMVIIQDRISLTAISRKDTELISIVEEFERLIGELHDTTMSLRMMPIWTTFNRFRRVVRDLSVQLGREVELVTEGGETELDKTIIERLSDPLIHILRNSIDHGVEPPEIRQANGKPKKGTVRLSAAYSGADVLITISDDGGGIDPEVIKSKAVEKGLLSTGAELSEKEIFGLIMLPGFSTAKQVSSVSGRGVGMDVVKEAVTALRGSVEIASKKGVGTTFTLKLPLTMAIIDGFLVAIGGVRFILPLFAVEECIKLAREEVEKNNHRGIINVRGEIVPYIRLRSWFMITGNQPRVEQAVIVRVAGSKIGLVVDSVIGEHHVVIKSLGAVYKDVEGISGATILGDGAVALIIDIPKIIKNVEKEEMSAA